MKLDIRIFRSAVIAAGIVGIMLGAGCAPPTNTDPNGGKAESEVKDTTNPDATAVVRPDPPVDGPAITGDTIKIGLVASQNGPLIPWGVDCINGVKLAVDLQNEKGGVDGKKIQLLVEDDASTPEGGKSAAEKLVSDGIIGLLGEVSSGITQPMSQVSFENGIPHIAVGATKTTITDMGSNVFRVCYTDDFQGPVMAKFAYDQGLRNVAIMTDEKQPYSQYLSKTFKEFFTKLGGTIAAEQSYESGQTTFTGQLSNIKSANPDGLFLSGYFTEVGPIVKQAGQLGLSNVTYMGGDGWDSNQLVKSGGDAIVGGFFCNHYNEHEKRKEVQDFLAAWRNAEQKQS